MISVCDVSLCPNLPFDGIQPFMGVPKGVPRVNRTSNETRDRLRSRLHEKHLMSDQKASKLPKSCCEEKVVNSTTKQTLSENNVRQTCTALPAKKCNGNNKNCCGLVDFKNMFPKGSDDIENDPSNRNGQQYEDIDKVMKFIEGKDIEMALKKAAKKARQKQKKDEEKRKREEELAKKRAEEERIAAEKRLEEERLKEILARQTQKKNKKSKNNQQTSKENESSTKSKKKNKKGKGNNTYEPELLEETIPAMVTIKRIVENNNSPPTVTITLKGSTPDQDKLLYTLVNGHDNRNNNSNGKSDGRKDDSKSNKKKKKGGNTEKTESITCKELKVTLSVDKSFRRELENKNSRSEPVNTKKKTQPKLQIDTKIVDKREQIIDIPSLKLPPGITITKVNGPLTNRKPNNVQSEYQNVPVNKSGVIVVDTEKLIQQSIGTKKSKKKKKKALQLNQNDSPKQNESNVPTMVTLKNPIFHKIQNKLNQPESSPMLNINEQATISKGANGMVTIRRPRQLSLHNDTAISDYVIHSSSHNTNVNQNFPADNKSTLSEDRKIIRPPSPRPTNSLNTSPQIDFENNRLCAQNILWGLPGIQITRVNKNNSPSEPESSDQTADVSIIRTGGFSFDKDDWQYESVFTPKDILEDDLDADERELEAFKRFCQQSIPPKHKEKVAHLNVKDIVLMKKNDITY